LKAYTKDIFRNISKGKKRFFAIMIITILGVTMFSGLKASCVDLRKSADAFFDESNLHDIQILSTLGLTDEDVSVLSKLDGVKLAEGGYNETVTAREGDVEINVNITKISDHDLDKACLLEGRMPENKGETAVTNKLLDLLSLKIGDKLNLSLDEDSNITSDSFEIVGVVIDPTDVDNPETASGYRGDSSAATRAFVTADSIDSEVDYYTFVNLIVDGAKEEFCYSNGYTSLTRAVITDIEDNLQSLRENARHDEIVDDATSEYEKAKKEAEDELNDALAELNDAQKEIDDAKAELADAFNTLTQNEADIENGLKEIADKKAELNDNLAQVRDGIAQVEAGIAQAKAYGMDTSGLEMQLADLKTNEAMILTGLDEIALNEAKLESGKAEIESGWNDYYKGLEDLKDGEAELADGWAEYNDGKAEADKELADAKKEIDDIDEAVWYVQERTALSGYNNIQTDADSIEVIGTVFPVIFFVVAILISLTTITRMVDEDRGLIGTYKAIGFTDREIRRKFILYSAMAGIIGAVIGTILAYIVFPIFLSSVFGIMYLLPDFILTFVPTYGFGGPIVFAGGIVLATVLACRSELSKMPATLMRPKTPKAGSRVLLERIPAIWSRMSFLNKVTARNLFRYKKRMLMTILGIAGCTALLLFGFAIRDSVTDLVPRQYEETFKYDALMVGTSDDNEKLLSYIEDEDVDSYVNFLMTQAKLKGESGEEISVQIVAVPDKEEFDEYVGMKDRNLEDLSLEDDEIFVTQNASVIVGFEEGEEVNLQLLDMKDADLEVNHIIKNYLGNYVYMTKETYEKHFGEYKANAFYINLSDSVENHAEWAKSMDKNEGVISCSSVQGMKDDFSQAFIILNLVVYVVIGMSAALAFVVLFTLSTTNISERERELATIKVLGFYDGEVHAYVNKETIILTLIGIAIGMPLGKFFGSTITSVLLLPSIYFESSLHVVSFLLSAVLSFVFAIAVNFITDRSLNKIDPIEALKSVE